jgi:subtilisin-like proprotein convertase family protein/ribosomal protein L27
MINKFTKYFLFSLCLMTACGNVSFAQLNWNQAGKFNGLTQPYTYLSTPNADEFNNINEIMIECWVCLTTSSGQYIFIDKGNANYRIAYSFGELYLRTDNAAANVSDLKISVSLTANRWYHIAAIVRDSATAPQPFSKVRELYIDGAPVKRDFQNFDSQTLGSSTDSLFIGGFGAPNFGHITKGYLDDVRIWVGKFYPADVMQNFRSPLSAWGNASSYYNKCILSIAFQDSDNSGAPFFVSDRSRYNHTIINNNVTAFDMSQRPSVTTYTNQSIHLDGSGQYLSAADHTSLSPTTALTMEAWVYPEKNYSGAFIDVGTILCKGISNANYRLSLGSDNSIYATINGNINFPSALDAKAPVNQWTHVAFTYDASNGNFNYYINGEPAGSGTNAQGNIINSTDSFYVGQSFSSYFFKGYIDELRISGYIKSEQQINNYLYRAIDLGNRSSAFELVCYNFDGYLENNNGFSPRLYFRSGAEFSSRYVSSSKNFPVSPLLKADNFNFPNAWYLKKNSFRIPSAGTFGSSKYDTINIPYCRGILDVNVFLALNHTYEEDLSVYLISPAGDSVEMIKNNTGIKRGQFTTIFNDQADSSIVSDRFTSFLPNIKPSTSLSSILSGENMQGNWKLRVNDGVNGDTGMVFAWGLQFNNMVSKPNLMTFNGTANQSGFWSGSNQALDTIRFILRNSVAPYSKVDSAIGYFNQFGFSTTYFANALNNSYYIEVKHRNSLSVWSNIPRAFTQGSTTSFNFLAGPGSVYGGELISINGRWCMYSGDINQDGAINGNDFTIFNQQFGQSGYIASDLNGDNTVNGNDFTVFNTGFGHQTNHP